MVKMKKNNAENHLTFDGHLELLRKIVIRVLWVVGAFVVVVFSLKDYVWRLLLAPSECDFYTYKWIEYVFGLLGRNFHFEDFCVDLIATDLSSQFMIHITTSCCLGALCASPYILLELYCFVSPALYDNEKKYSVLLTIVIYILFLLGILMSYFVLFPISFRFLGTYSVSERIHSTITINSYIETFVTLTFLMGVVFQLPVMAYIMAKMNVVSSFILSKYRKHAFVVIMIIAAIITPPDIITLLLVTIPLYVLFELSIAIIKLIEMQDNKKV